MTDFAQAFKNNHNISDAVEWDRLLVSQVLPSHSAKSHDFFEALGGIYSQNAFHLPLFTLTLFRTSQKPPHASIIFFLAN